jgi:hypothetical protein
MKIKCGDILFLPYLPEQFVEVGPGKRRDDTVHYEVFPIVNKGAFYEYDQESIWIPKKAIGEHYSVFDKEDFHNAWVSLGFEPVPQNDTVRFNRMFEYEMTTNDCKESLSTDSDTQSDLRSVCSWSTIESDSTLSIITNHEESDHDCTIENCVVCEDIRDTKRWFRHAWYPSTDPTECAVKRIIENIEEKYT